MACTFLYKSLSQHKFHYLISFTTLRSSSSALSIPPGWTETTAYSERSSVSNSILFDLVSFVECLKRRKFKTHTIHCALLHSSDIDGLDVVDKIESVGSQSGKTAKKVIVKDCGEL